MATIGGMESIAQAYAQALFNVAKAQSMVPGLMEEARVLGEALRKHPRLRYFLESPQISAEKKHALTDEVFLQNGSRLHPVLLNLLKMMIDRERAILLPKILEQFQEIAERAEGLFPARVMTARGLGEDEKSRLQAALEKFTKSRLKITWLVKPELLGGVVFRFRDTLVDGSIRHGLREIRQRLEETEIPSLEGGGIAA